LDMTVFSTAKLRLGDFIKAQHEPKPEIGTIGAGPQIISPIFERVTIR